MQAKTNSFATVMAKAFDAVCADANYEHNVRAGPIVIRFGFSSAALAAVYTKALLPETYDLADLQVRVLTPDDIDLSWLVPTPVEQGRAFSQGRYFSLWQPDRHAVLYLLDRVRKRGLLWLSDGRAPEWELSRPACPLIQTLISDTPWAMVHGAAVGQAGRVLLLAGKGRSGKSTAALSCALAGWDYASDDYVLAETSSGTIAPAYTSARLRTDMSGAFADILHVTVALSLDECDARHELRLGDHLDLKRFRGGRIAAILLPRRQGAQRPTFLPARRVDAINALFITLLGAPPSLRRAAAKVKSLVSLAPVFYVDTGAEPRAIPDAFERFLDQI